MKVLLHYNTGFVTYWCYVYQYTTPPDPDSLFCNPAAKYTDYKTSWPPEPIGHKSWKANRGSSQNQLSRPPPGLASQKQPSPSPWSGGAPRLAGRGWGGGSSTTGNALTHFSCCVGYKVVQFLHPGTVLVELFSWFKCTQEIKRLAPIAETQHSALLNLGVCWYFDLEKGWSSGTSHKTPSEPLIGHSKKWPTDTPLSLTYAHLTQHFSSSTGGWHCFGSVDMTHLKCTNATYLCFEEIHTPTFPSCDRAAPDQCLFCNSRGNACNVTTSAALFTSTDSCCIFSSLFWLYDLRPPCFGSVSQLSAETNLWTLPDLHQTPTQLLLWCVMVSAASGRHPLDFNLFAENNFVFFILLL